MPSMCLFSALFNSLDFHNYILVCSSLLCFKDISTSCYFIKLQASNFSAGRRFKLLRTTSSSSFSSFSIYSSTSVINYFNSVFVVSCSLSYCFIFLFCSLCLLLSLWPFQLYFIPYILPSILRSLTLFFQSYVM